MPQSLSLVIVHLAIRLSRTLTIAELVETLKTSSSKWLKTQAALSDFAWQRGYGCFSVALADLMALTTYIDNQEEHHRARISGGVSGVLEEV